MIESIVVISASLPVPHTFGQYCCHLGTFNVVRLQTSVACKYHYQTSQDLGCQGQLKVPATRRGWEGTAANNRPGFTIRIL